MKKPQRHRITNRRAFFRCSIALAMWLPTTGAAEATYTAMLESLRTGITGQLPAIPEAQRKAVEEAKDSKARVEAVSQIVELEPLLAGDALDEMLVKHFILKEATPAALEAYAKQSAAHQQRIDDLLANPALMRQIAVADGARPVHAKREGKGDPVPGNLGRVMELYTAIQKANPKSSSGVLQRLALAVSLEFSEAAAEEGAIDPLKRYRSFEKAYLAGELDPNFGSFTTWDLRFVVGAPESDAALAWGREMLRNYRPDHIYTNDEGGRYANLVGTDVKYGSLDVGNDRPDLMGPQNILMNGGICGRRSFFARFICRAFGVPATARPSSGHGASARWTPNGWVTILGPGWGHGRTTTRYQKDLDFLATTQARARGQEFIKVKRAYWIGDAMGEKRSYAEFDERNKPPFWNGVALATQRRIIEESKAVTLGAVGSKLGEADGKSVAQEIPAGEVGPEARNITVGTDGSIHIPTAAFNNVKKDDDASNDVIVMKSFEGGLQVYLPRFFRQQPILVRGGTYKHEATLCDSAARHWRGRRQKHSHHLRGVRLAVTPIENERPKEMTIELNDQLSMDFVYIPPGTFIMGGTRGEKEGDYLADTPKHEVTLTQGFYLGKHEVTNAQYAAILNKGEIQEIEFPDLPAVGVKPSRALLLCDELSSKTGLEIRLPTEAEWEYAARAGTTSRWHFGDDASKLGEYAWFKDNSEGKPHPVGQKKPNPWRLYDIYGNVGELVSDEHSEDYYANSPKVDPTGPLLGTYSDMQFTVEAPKAGDYTLTARVVTTQENQSIQLAVNGAESPTTLALPFTIGAWAESQPVTVTLKQGTNTLHFWRDQAPQFGVAVKSFTLKPTSGIEPKPTRTQ